MKDQILAAIDILRDALDFADMPADVEPLPSVPIPDGLTKREYFAAMALQGLCASDVWRENDYQQLALLAIRQADVTIKVLNGQTSQ